MRLCVYVCRANVNAWHHPVLNLFFEKGALAEPEFAGSFLPSPPHCWDHRHILYMCFRDESQILVIAEQALYWLNHLHGPKSETLSLLCLWSYEINRKSSIKKKVLRHLQREHEERRSLKPLCGMVWRSYHLLTESFIRVWVRDSESHFPSCFYSFQLLFE